MTIKLPASVVNFAKGTTGDTTLYENFADFWNHYRSENGNKKFSYTEEWQGKRLSLKDKEEALNVMLKGEISKMAKFDLDSLSPEAACTNPIICWATANIVSQMIDAIIPATIIDSTSAYAEVKTVGLGETAVFDIKPRDLFPVTKVGRGVTRRETEMHKGFENQATINPEGHQITVGVSLFRVLTGQESLADFTMKAMQSMETEMTRDIYSAFATSMATLSTDSTAGLQVSGYTTEDLVKLSQRVSTFMNNAKPVALGTKVALANILPDDTNYRYDIASEFVKLGYVRTISGVDTFEIPQVANWESPFGTYISDSYIWIVAPGTDKIVKCVIGGSTISNMDAPWASANLTQNATFIKNWKAGVVTSSTAAVISL